MSFPIVLDWVCNRLNQPVALPEPISVDALPTPALVLNRPAMQRNIARMADHLGSFGKGFRPHAKTHKCPIICQQQVAAGAVGVCVAKLGEAVAMVGAGIENILITSPIVSQAKAQVVAQLAQECPGLQIVVDSTVGLACLQAALPEHGKLSVLIDIDVAMGRTGVRELETILSLIQQIEGDSRLSFGGVQHYAGHLMHIAEFAKRRDKSLALWEKVADIIEALAQRSIICDVVTGAGTGTYDIDIEVPALTDLQVGSYIFMDEEYRCVSSQQTERFEAFEVSLHVACTAISQPRQGAITVDGGYKAFASDSVAPVSDELADVTFHFGGDEHGVLALPKGEQALRLGQVLKFVVPHCDPTVNLHDFYWVQEADGLIHSCWPVTARGAAW